MHSITVNDGADWNVIPRIAQGSKRIYFRAIPKYIYMLYIRNNFDTIKQSENKAKRGNKGWIRILGWST